ncbi:MAG: allantoicase [Oceanospirillaceae bacterium]
MSTEQSFQKYINLADARLGAKVIAVSDDWFAAADRMLQAEPAIWKEGVFDDNGKWMDGWESRRKRFEGFDHAIIKLGVAGTIKGVEIDTSYFTGNYPPSASLEACYCEQGDPGEHTQWTEILGAVALAGDSQHFHAIENAQPWSHLRFNIFPDGGIARLRVHGIPFHNWSKQDPDQSIDFASSLNGGRALACSDEHFGQMRNILNPGRGINMGDGWETARRRTPGFDWVIVALGHEAEISDVLIDTLHFKGNYPDSCSIQGAFVKGGTDEQVETQSLFWQELLPSQKLEMHQEHEFNQLNDIGPITHVRLNIFPDGGVSRMRLFGKISSHK